MTATWERTDRSGDAPWTALLLISLGLHAGGFILALALPRLIPHRPSGPPVYIVDLVSLSPGPPVAAPAAPAPAAARTAAPPPPKAEKPIAIPDRGAKKPDPKKTPPKEAAPKPETKPEPAKPSAAVAEATAAPATSAPPGSPPPGAAAPAGAQGAAGAVAGGSGGTGTRAADEYTFYFSLLERKIRGAWKKPIFPPQQTAVATLEAKIRLSLTSSGRVVALDLTLASGYDALDRSAMRAVQEGQPFPPFPYQLGVDTLTVDFEFALKPGEE